MLTPTRRSELANVRTQLGKIVRYLLSAQVWLSNHMHVTFNLHRSLLGIKETYITEADLWIMNQKLTKVGIVVERS